MSVFSQLMMKNKSNKEIFSNVLDYDKTMFLCHFENNLNNWGNHSFIFADGQYDYNSDAKFGNYSVANTRNGMVWWNNNITNENKTLECWMKILSEEEYYFCLALANNSWGSQCGVEIKNYDNGCCLYDNANIEYFNLPNNFKQNDWNHIAITYSSIVNNYITMTLWINGEFCKSMQIYSHTDVARFKAVGMYNQQRCSCLIDELVLLNYVRYTKNFEVQHKSYVIGFEYYEVDYIETTGTQRIATDLYGSSTPLNNYSVEVDCVFYNANENAIIVNNWAVNSYFLMAYGNACRWHGTPNVFDFGNLQLNVRYKIKIDVQNSLVYLDNTSYNCNPGNCGTSEIMLLGISDNNNNHSNKGFNGKIYRIKFYSPNGDLVRDYVPVYNSTLQQYCLLDKVENTLYLNNGTGTINGGND